MVKIKLPNKKVKQEIRPPSPKTGFVVWVSQSALNRFQECRRKARLVMDGWTPKKSSRALRYGSLFHEVLELCTRHSIRIEKSPSEAFVDGVVMNSVREWEEDNQQWMKVEKIVEEMRIDAALVTVAMNAYIKHYVQDFNGSKKWVALEKKFEVPYKGMILLGYIDAIYEEKGRLNILETKTRGRFNPDMVDLLHIDFQTFYYLHGIFLATGKFPKSLVFNIVKKFEGKLKVKETIEELATRFAEDLKLHPENYFKRIHTSIDQAEYAKWVKENLDPLLDEFKAWREGKIPDYCNTTNCDGKYGSCDFLQICACSNYTNFTKKSKADKDRDIAKRKIKEEQRGMQGMSLPGKL